MLYGNMQESRHNAEIEITDISCRAFEYIRDLFYHFNPMLTSSIVLEVAVAASKYCIDHLIAECVNHLRTVSNLDEWHRLIQQLQTRRGSCFGMEVYLKALIDENYMVNNCSKELCADLKQFYALSVDTLCRVLRSDNFNCPEEWIWTKCLGFALHQTRRQCNAKAVPVHIEQLIEAHLSVPKRLQRRHAASDFMAKHQYKNWERIMVKRGDIYMEHNEFTSGDIVLEPDGDDENVVNLTIDSESGPDRDEAEDKETEPEPEPVDEQQFVSTFKEMMEALAEHIRFTAMNPLFFIRLVQRADILPAERIVDIQNWTICKTRPHRPDAVLVTTSRKRRYLRYFQDIQSGASEPRSGSSKSHRNRMTDSNRNRRRNRQGPSAVTVEDEGKSEDQGDGARPDGDGGHEAFVEFEGSGFDDDGECTNSSELCFNHLEICFDATQCSGLRVNDHIDHRDNVGRFATAMIVDVDTLRQRVKLHYIGWQSKWDLWCDVASMENQIRFCVAGAVSTRLLHRREFVDMELKDLHVKCRLARYWYHNHPDVDPAGDEWRDAQIKREDKHSGQVQLVVRIGTKDYLWWVHLDSVDEVRPCEDHGESRMLPELEDVDEDDFEIAFPPPPPPPTARAGRFSLIPRANMP